MQFYMELMRNFSQKLKKIGITKTYKIQFDGIVNFIEEQSKLTYVKSISRWANKYMNEYPCDKTRGSRLNKESTSYKIGNENAKDLTNMDLSKFYNWVKYTKELNKINKNFISNF